MSPTLANRRGRSLIATIIADPYRKLAAIALALGLWYFLNHQITRHLPVEMLLTWGQQNAGTSNTNRLRVLLGAENVVGRGFSANGEERTSVTITFTGQSADVDRVEGGDLQLTVDFSRITDWSNRDYVEFKVTDIQAAGRVRQLEMQMDPPIIRLDVQRVVDWQVPLRLDKIDLVVDNAEISDRLRKDTAKFLPGNTARIIGPARSIDALKQADKLGQKPFKATITGTRNDRDLSVLVGLNAPENSGLKIESDPIMAIKVAPKTETFDLELPLMIDDLALQPGWRNQYRPAEEMTYARVTINAGGDLLGKLTTLKDQSDAALDDWAKSYLRLYVLVPPLDAAQTPPDELVTQATLKLFGTQLESRVELSDYSLTQPFAITLVRRQ